jgi:osmotically-inducible protein OsmY
MKELWPFRLLAYYTLIATMLFNLSGCAAILLGSVAIGAIAHDRRTTGTIMDDQTIEFKVHKALNHQLPPGNRIDATSYNGTVLLTGTATSELIKRRAGSIVFNVTPPIRKLYNELVVSSPELSFSELASSSLLTAKFKAALLKIRIQDFDPSRVKVVTENHILYLMGLMRKEEADAVVDIASQISGVHRIVTLFENFK